MGRGLARWPAGTVCVLVASGPSLTVEQLHPVRIAREADACRVIVVNDCWKLAPWADVLYACDKRWWDKKRPQGASAFGGLGVTQDYDAAEAYGLVYVPSHSGRGLNRTPWATNQGLNSGYQAINLAYHFGASRMLLLGYDMQATGGKSHWFGDHPPGLQVPSPYKQFAERFVELARDLQAAGVAVVNCSAETALTCFPRGDIHKELQ